MATGSDSEILSISAQEYSEFSAFLREACGINLGENKQYLVTTRVRRILLEKGMGNLGELTRTLKIEGSKPLRQRVIDAMTTNETYWFRDTYPFSYLADTLLPELVANQRKQPLRIWSAACSTGQEPYSISMIYREFVGNCRGKFVPQLDVLATDLCSEALDSAKKGCYSKYSLTRGLSEARIARYFVREKPDLWRVAAEISEPIRFRPMNLQDSFVLLGRFDAIFCRNVLIYFASELKCEILTKMHAALNPGGYLFLGSSESIAGVGHLFEMVHCQTGVVYRALKK